MTIRHLKLFIEVASHKSITKAANALYVSQPTVSIAIKELEDHYGIVLFDRINQRIKITQEGIRFLDYSKHIIQLMEEMEQTFTNSDILGDIHMGSSITYGIVNIPKIARKFKDIHPMINLKVQIHASDVIEQMVIQNSLDFGIIEGVVHSDYLKTIELETDRLIAVCSPGYRLEHSGSMTIQHLASEKILTREQNSGIREIFDTYVEMHGYTVKPYWESTSIEAIIQGALSGIGIGIVPENLVSHHLEKESLMHLEIEDFEIIRSQKIIYHRNKFISPTTEALIKLIQNMEQ